MTHSNTAAGSHPVIRTLRAVSGLYLLLYITSHLINLSLGLISIEAMDAARPYLSGFLGHPVLRPVLLTALLVHYAIGLRSIYMRPRISGTTEDLVQALSGLAIMPLLAIHAIGIIMLQNAEVVVSYDFIVRVFWIGTPSYGLMQVILLSVAWIHGGAGLFMWLRSKRNAVHILPWLYPLAVAVPVLALLGFTEAGRRVLASRIGPEIVRTNVEGSLPDVPFALIINTQYTVLWASIAISVLVLLARGLRRWLAEPAVVNITTKDTGKIKGQTGISLLDAFRDQGQAHANLCSGRGRCGTCAVRILATDQDLPEPTPLEQATLSRIDKGGDVRLACQLQMLDSGTLSVERIYPPDYSFEASQADQPVSDEVTA
ncbi:MAG: 2Fe-2S iron-sulfur cluster-binding protein [Sulfitobacter sp.]